MSAIHDRPRPAGTLMARIETFFLNNPDEWLTWPDMAAKFSCTEDQARTAMNGLRECGRLEWQSVATVRLVRAP